MIHLQLAGNAAEIHPISIEPHCLLPQRFGITANFGIGRITPLTAFAFESLAASFS